MTEKNVFTYNFFLSLNVSDFNLFFCENCTPPPEKSYPPLSQQHPSKSCSPVKHPTLFLNIFGGAHYEHMHDFYK